MDSVSFSCRLSVLQLFIPAGAEDLLLKDFERIGRLRYKDRLNREMLRLGWFCLVGSSLHIRLEEHTADETIDLQKLLELCESQKCHQISKNATHNHHKYH